MNPKPTPIECEELPEIVSKGVVKTKKSVKIVEKAPKWQDLHWTLTETADHLLKSLLNRKDIPCDAMEIIRGVLCLRETKELFYAEGDKISPFSCEIWAEELKKWASATS